MLLPGVVFRRRPSARHRGRSDGRLGGLAIAVFAGLLVTLTAAMAMPALAGPASVLEATVEAEPGGTYAFTATINHDDKGWTDYADKYDILTPDGKVIATRPIYSPHVGKMPVVRSLAHVDVPLGVDSVIIRAHSSADGPGRRTVTLKLPPRR